MAPVPRLHTNASAKFSEASRTAIEAPRTDATPLCGTQVNEKQIEFPGGNGALIPAILFIVRYSALFASPLYAGSPDIERINKIVDELRVQLQMRQEIQVTIAKANPLMVSVEHDGGTRSEAGIFVICFDESFLASLDPDELRAAVAHELGHVWIFSHHPYLQTEALANEIALRAVQRDSLKKIYSKLWIHLGASGSIDEFSESRTPRLPSDNPGLLH